MGLRLDQSDSCKLIRLKLLLYKYCDSRFEHFKVVQILYCWSRWIRKIQGFKIGLRLACVVERLLSFERNCRIESDCCCCNCCVLQDFLFGVRFFPLKCGEVGLQDRTKVGPIG